MKLRCSLWWCPEHGGRGGDQQGHEGQAACFGSPACPPFSHGALEVVPLLLSELGAITGWVRAQGGSEV